jgi:glycosyltransferase involved in cell wall biosynthesis
MTVGGNVDVMPSAIYCLTDSFSKSSGGRTAAIFDRAAALALPDRPATVLATAFKLSFREIADGWIRRTGGTGVRFGVLWEHVAGEPVFLPAGAPQPAMLTDARWDDDLEGWVVERDTGLDVVRLRDDGSASSIRRFQDGRKVLRQDLDRQGNVLRRSHFSSADPDQAERVEYVSAAGRHYMTAIRTRQGTTRFEVIGHDGSVVRRHLDVEDLVHRWIADLAAASPEAVFVSDVRQWDEAVVANRYRSRVRHVVAVHSSHVQWTGDRYVPDEYNSPSLARVDQHDATVVLTEEQRDDIVRNHGSLDRLYVVPHAVRATPRRARREHDLVLATRLHPVKQLDHVLRAVALVNRSRPRMSVAIWGTGPERARLAHLVTTLGLDGVVQLRGHTEDPASALASGRLSVSTSRGEGFGLAVAESLAQGTPVVSYDYKYGPRDLVGRARAGLLVPRDDVEALASAIIDLLASPVRRRLMAQRGRRHVARWGPDEYGRRWERILADVDALHLASAGQIDPTSGTSSPK